MSDCAKFREDFTLFRADFAYYYLSTCYILNFLILYSLRIISSEASLAFPFFQLGDVNIAVVFAWILYIIIVSVNFTLHFFFETFTIDQNILSPYIFARSEVYSTARTYISLFLGVSFIIYFDEKVYGLVVLNAMLVINMGYYIVRQPYFKQYMNIISITSFCLFIAIGSAEIVAHSSDSFLASTLLASNRVSVDSIDLSNFSIDLSNYRTSNNSEVTTDLPSTHLFLSRIDSISTSLSDLPDCSTIFVPESVSTFLSSSSFRSDSAFSVENNNLYPTNYDNINNNNSDTLEVVSPVIVSPKASSYSSSSTSNSDASTLIETVSCLISVALILYYFRVLYIRKLAHELILRFIAGESPLATALPPHEDPVCEAEEKWKQGEIQRRRLEVIQRIQEKKDEFLRQQRLHGHETDGNDDPRDAYGHESGIISRGSRKDPRLGPDGDGHPGTQSHSQKVSSSPMPNEGDKSSSQNPYDHSKTKTPSSVSSISVHPAIINDREHTSMSLSKAVKKMESVLVASSSTVQEHIFGSLPTTTPDGGTGGTDAKGKVILINSRLSVPTHQASHEGDTDEPSRSSSMVGSGSSMVGSGSPSSGFRSCETGELSRSSNQTLSRERERTSTKVIKPHQAPRGDSGHHISRKTSGMASRDARETVDEERHDPHGYGSQQPFSTSSHGHYHKTAPQHSSMNPPIHYVPSEAKAHGWTGELSRSSNQTLSRERERTSTKVIKPHQAPRGDSGHHISRKTSGMASRDARETVDEERHDPHGYGSQQPFSTSSHGHYHKTAPQHSSMNPPIHYVPSEAKAGSSNWHRESLGALYTNSVAQSVMSSFKNTLELVDSDVDMIDHSHASQHAGTASLERNGSGSSSSMYSSSDSSSGSAESLHSADTDPAHILQDVSVSKSVQSPTSGATLPETSAEQSREVVLSIPSSIRSESRLSHRVAPISTSSSSLHLLSSSGSHQHSDIQHKYRQILRNTIPLVQRGEIESYVGADVKKEHQGGDIMIDHHHDTAQPNPHHAGPAAKGTKSITPSHSPSHNEDVCITLPQSSPRVESRSQAFPIPNGHEDIVPGRGYQPQVEFVVSAIQWLRRLNNQRCTEGTLWNEKVQNAEGADSSAPIHVGGTATASMMAPVQTFQKDLTVSEGRRYMPLLRKFPFLYFLSLNFDIIKPSEFVDFLQRNGGLLSAIHPSTFNLIFRYILGGELMLHREMGVRSLGKMEEELSCTMDCQGCQISTNNTSTNNTNNMGTFSSTLQTGGSSAYGSSALSGSNINAFVHDYPSEIPVPYSFSLKPSLIDTSAHRSMFELTKASTFTNINNIFPLQASIPLFINRSQYSLCPPTQVSSNPADPVVTGDPNDLPKPSSMLSSNNIHPSSMHSLNPQYIPSLLPLPTPSFFISLFLLKCYFSAHIQNSSDTADILYASALTMNTLLSLGSVSKALELAIDVSHGIKGSSQRIRFAILAWKNAFQKIVDYRNLHYTHSEDPNNPDEAHDNIDEALHDAEQADGTTGGDRTSMASTNHFQNRFSTTGYRSFAPSKGSQLVLSHRGPASTVFSPSSQTEVSLSSTYDLFNSQFINLCDKVTGLEVKFTHKLLGMRNVGDISNTLLINSEIATIRADLVKSVRKQIEGEDQVHELVRIEQLIDRHLHNATLEEMTRIKYKNILLMREGVNIGLSINPVVPDAPHTNTISYMSNPTDEATVSHSSLQHHQTFIQHSHRSSSSVATSTVNSLVSSVSSSTPSMMFGETFSKLERGDRVAYSLFSREKTCIFLMGFICLLIYFIVAIAVIRYLHSKEVVVEVGDNLIMAEMSLVRFIASVHALSLSYTGMFHSTGVCGDGVNTIYCDPYQTPDLSSSSSSSASGTESTSSLFLNDSYNINSNKSFASSRNVRWTHQDEKEDMIRMNTKILNSSLEEMEEVLMHFMTSDYSGDDNNYDNNSSDSASDSSSEAMNDRLNRHEYMTELIDRFASTISVLEELTSDTTSTESNSFGFPVPTDPRKIQEEILLYASEFQYFSHHINSSITNYYSILCNDDIPNIEFCSFDIFLDEILPMIVYSSNVDSSDSTDDSDPYLLSDPTSIEMLSFISLASKISTIAINIVGMAQGWDEILLSQPTLQLQYSKGFGASYDILNSIDMKSLFSLSLPNLLQYLSSLSSVVRDSISENKFAARIKYTIFSLFYFVLGMFILHTSVVSLVLKRSALFQLTLCNLTLRTSIHPNQPPTMVKSPFHMPLDNKSIDKGTKDSKSPAQLYYYPSNTSLSKDLSSSSISIDAKESDNTVKTSPYRDGTTSIRHSHRHFHRISRYRSVSSRRGGRGLQSRTNSIDSTLSSSGSSKKVLKFLSDPKKKMICLYLFFLIFISLILLFLTFYTLSFQHLLSYDSVNSLISSRDTVEYVNDMINKTTMKTLLFDLTGEANYLLDISSSIHLLQLLMSDSTIDPRFFSYFLENSEKRRTFEMFTFVSLDLSNSCYENTFSVEHPTLDNFYYTASIPYLNDEDDFERPYPFTSSTEDYDKICWNEDEESGETTVGDRILTAISTMIDDVSTNIQMELNESMRLKLISSSADIVAEQMQERFKYLFLSAAYGAVFLIRNGFEGVALESSGLVALHKHKFLFNQSLYQAAHRIARGVFLGTSSSVSRAKKGIIFDNILLDYQNDNLLFQSDHPYFPEPTGMMYDGPYPVFHDVDSIPFDEDEVSASILMHKTSLFTLIDDLVDEMREYERLSPTVVSMSATDIPNMISIDDRYNLLVEHIPNIIQCIMDLQAYLEELHSDISDVVLDTDYKLTRKSVKFSGQAITYESLFTIMCLVINMCFVVVNASAMQKSASAMAKNERKKLDDTLPTLAFSRLMVKPGDTSNTSDLMLLTLESMDRHFLSFNSFIHNLGLGNSSLNSFMRVPFFSEKCNILQKEYDSDYHKFSADCHYDASYRSSTSNSSILSKYNNNNFSDSFQMISSKTQETSSSGNIPHLGISHKISSDQDILNYYKANSSSNINNNVKANSAKSKTFSHSDLRLLHPSSSSYPSTYPTSLKKRSIQKNRQLLYMNNTSSSSSSSSSLHINHSNSDGTNSYSDGTNSYSDGTDSYSDGDQKDRTITSVYTMTEEDEDIPLTEPADYTECLICSHGIPIIEISKGYDLSSLDNDFCEDSMSADMFSSPVSTAIERIIGSIGNGSKMTLFDSNDYFSYDIFQYHFLPLWQDSLFVGEGMEMSNHQMFTAVNLLIENVEIHLYVCLCLKESVFLNPKSVGQKKISQIVEGNTGK
ncbi:hypothetical protein ADUPG1_012989 [Aduncisulcus paluster]|uniref:Uncharacterized protein n=1 Tax=Aduncisulcus paluster TaxID=2918883 RepID=A0ABQ5K652_9EUKA|nr:hypothetical protein ADUPG1_012989 [Aduncisulcus paluster]